MEALSAYIPIDRRQALACAVGLPDRVAGAALFADISGFTPLTSSLAQELGAQRGAEELTRHLNLVYGALIAEVDRYGGSVISFSGDAITCWFDSQGPGVGGQGSGVHEPFLAPDSWPLAPAALRAVACALEMQRTLSQFAGMATPAGTAISLGIKVAIAAGSCRRFLVGHPRIQTIEVLAGSLLDRVTAAEQQAQRGEVVVGAEVIEQLGTAARVQAWRTDSQGQRYAVLAALAQAVPPAPWPDIPQIGADTARDWLLPPVYQRLARGEGDYLSELRPAVTLFLKFKGIDYDSDDQAEDKLDAYIRWVQEQLVHYEGYLLQLTIGDKGSYFHAAFGAPTAHEDDPARAVAAALALQAPPATLGFIHDIRIGISQGQMHAGAYGATSRRTYGVLGAEVNIAARLMSLAQPGQILATSQIAYAVRVGYDMSELGPQSLKGKAEPIPVFVVRGRRQEQSVDTLKGRVPTQIIGRAAERAILAEQLQALLDGQSGSIVIEGEAGIGKSQLISDLMAQAEASGIGHLLGAGDAIERSTAYHAWRPVFGQLFHLTTPAEDFTADSRHVWRKHVLAQLAAIDPDLLRLAPLLDAVLPIDLPDNDLTAQMSGDVRANNTHDLLVSLLRHRARGRPLLLVLEDAHWYDSSSWTLARIVSVDVAPLLLVVSTRPLPDPLPIGYEQIRHAPHTRHFALETLAPSEINALVCRRLGVRSLPAPVSELILAKAEGHPFFSEELAYAVRDAGLIRIVGQTCQLAPGVRELRAFDFPDTIHGVITSRVDRLAPAQQLTLKVASVIGRIFLYATLENIYPIETDKPALLAHLDILHRLDITHKEAIETELTYIFKHIMAQEAVYSLLLYTQRRQLHHAVARWYEETFAHDLSPFYPLLAYHWRQADVRAKATDYLEKAGEQALRSGAFLEAARFFEEVLELAVGAPTAAPQQASAEQARQAGWRWRLGEAYYRLGHMAQGRAQSERAMAVFDRPIPATAGQLLRGTLRQLARQVLHRLWPGRFTNDTASNDRERRLIVVSIYQTLSQIYYLCKEQGLSLYAALRQVNVAEQAGASLELAQAYAVMCIITGIFGLHRVAESYHDRALAVARHLAAQPYVMASVLHRVSIYRVGIGQFARARDGFTQAMHTYQQLGDRGASRDCLGLLVSVEYYAGEFDRALQLIATFPAALSNEDRGSHLFWGMEWQSGIALRQKRIEDTLAWLERASGFLGSDVEGLAEISYFGLMALARWQHGEPGPAQEAAARANHFIAQSKGVPLSHFSLDGYMAVAEVYMAGWEAAAPARAPGKGQRAAARRACRNLRLFQRFFPIGQPAAWLYQGWYDWLAGKPTRAYKAWRKSLAAAERLAMLYEQGRAHYEIGRHLPVDDPERPAHMARALDIFARLGVADDAQRAPHVFERSEGL